MEYRKLPNGEEQISILGIGTSGIGMAGEKEAGKVAELAIENGINYFDMASADDVPFAAFGRATAGIRNKIYYQVHFGADYHTGKYGWTMNLDKIKKSIDWQLQALNTDYIDFGFIHCIDEEADLRTVEKAASDCIACGHCDSRCPFHVEQVKRMKIIQEYFGK